MLIDLVCLATLGVAVYLGWRRGLLLSAVALASVVAGYACAYFFFRPLGDLLGRAFSLQPLLAYPLGGAIAFVIAALLLSALRLYLGRRRKAALRRGARELLAGRVAGAALGALYASGLLLILLWSLSWLHVALPGRVPGVRASLAGRIAAPLQALLARRLAAGLSVPPVLTSVADRLARDPRQTARSLNIILHDSRVRALVGVAGPPSSGTAALGELSADPEFLREAERAGLLQRAAVGPLSPEQARTLLAARMAPIQRALDAMTRDPEVQSRLADPDLRDRIRRRDLLGLANDPGFNRLLQRLLDDMRGSRPVAGSPAVKGP